jgi:hypothetical protein
MMLYKLRQTVILLISLLLFPVMLSAQSAWVDDGQERSFLSIEIIKPLRNGDSLYGSLLPRYATFSGSIFLTGRYDVGKNFVLAADISIANGKLEGEKSAFNGPETILGNPYIGAEYYLSETPLFFELGMRIPVVPEGKGLASITGFYSDFDRAEAFLPHVVPVYLAANYEKITTSKILLRARTGVNLWFMSKEKETYRNPVVFVDYTLQTGYSDPRVTIIVGLTGRIDVSSEPRYKEKAHFLQFGTTLTVPFGNFRPGINFRIPGNKYTADLIDFVFGLNLAYVFK